MRSKKKTSPSIRALRAADVLLRDLLSRAQWLAFNGTGNADWKKAARQWMEDFDRELPNGQSLAMLCGAGRPAGVEELWRAIAGQRQ